MVLVSESILNYHISYFQIRIFPGCIFHTNYPMGFHREESLAVPVWSRVSSSPNRTASLSGTEIFPLQNVSQSVCALLTKLKGLSSSHNLTL